MKGVNTLPWICVLFTMCIMSCTAIETTHRRFKATLAPFHYELDLKLISATQEENRISCGLKCTNTADCVAFLYGSMAPEAMADGCYTGAMASYSGQQNISTFGYTCQRWQDDSPHGHWYHDQPENYCRDPTLTGYMWCYTTDPAMRWDYCDIGKCYPDTNCRLIRAPLPAESYDHPGFTFYGTA